MIFLKLLVAGHMTIYLTRNKGPIWQRPWPSWKLFAATETTQLLGTLAVVYGWFVRRSAGADALLVWAYALAWFLINSGCKIMAYGLINRHAQLSLGKRCPPIHQGLHAPGPSGSIS